MGVLPQIRVGARAWFAAGFVFLTSCATTTPRPQQFRSFFLPPAPPPQAGLAPEFAETPPFLANSLRMEVANLTTNVPSIARPSDTEFLIRRADDRFAAGKKALQEGRLEDARKEFNRSIEILLTAPPALDRNDTPDRTK